MRDPWAGADLGSFATSYTASVPAKSATLLTVTGTEGSTVSGHVGTIVGTQSGRCLDVNNFATANGSPAQLWDCNNQSNQSWTYTSTKQLVLYGNKCLDAYNNGTANGTQVDIWDCNGQTNQQWNMNSDGTITGVSSGLCLDAYNAATANGTTIVLWACGSASNQKWTLT